MWTFAALGGIFSSYSFDIVGLTERNKPLPHVLLSEEKRTAFCGGQAVSSAFCFPGVRKQ